MILFIIESSNSNKLVGMTCDIKIICLVIKAIFDTCLWVYARFQQGRLDTKLIVTGNQLLVTRQETCAVEMVYLRDTKTAAS